MSNSTTTTDHGREPTPRDPDLTELEAEDRAYQRLFGVRLSAVFATVFLSYGAMQIPAFALSVRAGLIEGVAAAVSVVLNAVIGGTTLLFFFYARGLPSDLDERGYRQFRRAAWFWLGVVIVGALGHIHLAGSMNTVNVALLLGTFLFVQRILGATAAWISFIVSLVGFLLLICAEYIGLLSYAPLLVEGAGLKRPLLEPWHVAGNFLNFLVLSLIVLAAFDRFESERQRLHGDLRRLTSMLPRCAECGRVRDDPGYWDRLERYLQGPMPVTQRICPTCMADPTP